MSNKTFFCLIAMVCTLTLQAQIVDPVQWTFDAQSHGDTLDMQFTANIVNGWHLYGTDLPSGGPQPTIFTFTTTEQADLVGDIVAERTPHSQYDPTFDMQLNWFSGTITFHQKAVVRAADYSIAGHVAFMACDDRTCTPPTEVEFRFGQTAAPAMLPLPVGTPAPTAASDLYTPVVDELRAFGSDTATDTDESLWTIFLFGLVGGLLALFTPCVWPIIPMTVSFFLKRTDNKRQGRRDALLYGISIIIIYVGLGLLITLLFGASALNSLSTNAIFNLFLFALLVVFALSFFGMFEITLPASWSTKLDARASRTSGIVSILLMAFTLAVVSFSCTGPIIGTLLVEVSTKNSFLAPTIGMFGFALALALPFSLFAMFPSWLKSMPRSGGWLNAVKVVLGFLELALSLKFLSVADLAYGWHLLDREVFIVLWIVIFAFLGLYLLGKITLPHDDKLERVSVLRLVLALVSFAFAIYMVPGLWGAPLKAVSAFAPPLSTQDFNIYQNHVEADFDDYEAALNYAKRHNKPLVVDFSGYGCVNCRKMEAAVWTDAGVADLLHNEFVLASLYVDDKTPLDEPFTVEENGTTRLIKTIGDKNSYLQRTKFGANAQPFYVVIDTDGRPLNGAFAFDENPQHFVDFLTTALKNKNN
ncbi:MAG: protein-disulfide reductase DsbD family protein [Paludibacteraceae bacterium]